MYTKFGTLLVYEHQCRFCEKINFFFNFKFVMHSESPLLTSFIIFDSPIPLFVTEANDSL